MLNKVYAEPDECFPYLDDVIVADQEADQIVGPSHDIAFEEPPELVDLPSRNNVESPRHNRTDRDTVKKDDLLSTSLHTLDSLPSIVLPFQSCQGSPKRQEEEELDSNGLLRPASEILMPASKNVTPKRPQKEKICIKNEDGWPSSDNVDLVKHLPTNGPEAKPVQSTWEEPSAAAAASNSTKTKMNLVFALLVTLAAICHFALFQESTILADDNSDNLDHQEPHRTVESRIPDMVANFSLPKSSSPLGKAVDISLKGVSVHHQGFNEVEIETYSLDSWNSIGNTTLRASWVIAFVFLLFLASQWTGGHSTGRVEQEENKSKGTAVKIENTNGDGGFDLSAYEKMHVVQLRELLRQRGCKTIGKKPVLIRRLATVYKAELSSYTVAQLRKILKANNYTQTGRKDVIIRTLIEAGIGLKA
eukprot:scaffold1051_cov119-Cylindrotheca_fusiformis.AAC.9